MHLLLVTTTTSRVLFISIEIFKIRNYAPIIAGRNKNYQKMNKKVRLANVTKGLQEEALRNRKE